MTTSTYDRSYIRSEYDRQRKAKSMMSANNKLNNKNGRYANDEMNCDGVGSVDELK